MEWDELQGLFPSFAGADRWLPLLQRHAELLAAAAPRVRVTAVAAEDAVQRHYAESLELWRIVSGEKPDADAVVDVGSGGGFPGLVIATVEPGIRVQLVEPLKKRAALLEECAHALGLANVRVHAQRAEDAGRGPLRDATGIVIARAVAQLSELLEYTAPLAAPGGLIALPKGSRGAGEAAAAGRALAELSCSFHRFVPMRPEISETVSVALIRKMAPTSAGYPRRAGVPGKSPL